MSHVVSQNPLSSVGNEVVFGEDSNDERFKNQVLNSDEDILEFEEGSYRASSQF